MAAAGSREAQSLMTSGHASLHCATCPREAEEGETRFTAAVFSGSPAFLVTNSAFKDYAMRSNIRKLQ